MPVTNPQKGSPQQHPKIEIKSAPLPTLWARLRQIKKKDLAFILAGLAVLILAPVAQHYMLSPQEGDGLEPGFSTREGGSGTGEVFEPGLGGFAPGTAPGGTDVITPLSARDPSSLLMPPGGPPAPPKTSAADNIRDALNRALRQGSEQAVEKASLPQPMPRMASTLRGLAGLAGGSANVAPLPIGGGAVLEGAHKVPNQSGPRAYAGPIAPSDFKGAERSGATSSNEAFEALKSAADKAAGHFSGHGRALEGLTNAAAEGIHGGGVGLGGGTAGPGDLDKDAKHSGNNMPPGRYELGESLQYQLAKMRAQKEMDLEFKKREMIELLPYKMWEKFIEMGMEKIIGDGFMKGMGECVGKTMKGESCFASGEGAKEFLCLNKTTPGNSKKLNAAKIKSKYQKPDGRWEVIYKGDEKEDEFTYECDDLISLHDKLEAKPDGAGPRKREVKEAVRAQIGSTNQSLDALINDPGASAETKEAAKLLKAAAQRAQESLSAVDSTIAPMAQIKAKDVETLKAAHNLALDPMQPKGSIGTAFGAASASGDAAQAAFADGKKPAAEYKKLHDQYGKDFESAMNALAPSVKKLGEIGAALSESRRQLDVQEQAIKAGEEKWTEAGSLRDQAKKKMEEAEKGGVTTAGAGQATTVGKAKQLKGNLAEVDGIIKTAGESVESANSERFTWENTVHTDIAPKLAQVESLGSAFLKEAPKLHAHASAELGPSYYGEDSTRKAKTDSAAKSRVELGEKLKKLEDSAAAAHQELTKDDPVREGWKEHASH